MLDMKLTGWLATAFAYGAVWFGGGAMLSSLNILKAPINEKPFMLVGWLVIIILCIATHIIFVMIREGRREQRNKTANLTNTTQATDS